MEQESDGKRLTAQVSPRDHMWGSPSATVTLVEYGDYECSLSGQVYCALKENVHRFGSGLCFVFRHFPMHKIHPEAQYAAEATEAAGAQNKFWEMHEMLFAHPKALEKGALISYVVALRMDVTRFLRDMSQHIYADRVQRDLQSGMGSGVNSTPTLFINGAHHDTFGDMEAIFTAVEDTAVSQQNGTAAPQCGERLSS